ncbi:MAG: hypothetical protein HC915_07885 [Anaerolineae bacterium]|nr:hypothetical protein [Anaerolineae bacterium]
MTDNIFYDHWRECLREHYLHVLRSGDWITEPSLREVLKSTGFTEAELEALAAETVGREARPVLQAEEPPAPVKEALPAGAAEALGIAAEADAPAHTEDPPPLTEDDPDAPRRWCRSRCSSAQSASHTSPISSPSLSS